MIRLFTIDDYENAYKLWKRTSGVGLRSIDDSKEGINRLLRRNPTTNFVAEEKGYIIGTALSGQDGRRGYLYHICVDEQHRHKSIGGQLSKQVIDAMKTEGITKLALICFAHNNTGNEFWRSQGWTKRTDLNYYDLSLEEDNTSVLD